MRHPPSAAPAQGHCTEVMIGVVVRQDQPADGLAGDRTDRAHQLLPLRGTGERIAHYDAVAGHDESRIRATFRAATRVTEHDVDAGGQLANGKLLRAEG